VIIDGFKSYSQRTVISGWDQEFNAITGLNGSGKSNILDAICFVLGISNLSQVRAASLQDLIYKQGQAGVTKATVTLVFNNSDPKTSPVGQELCETISVTRQVRGQARRTPLPPPPPPSPDRHGRPQQVHDQRAHRGRGARARHVSVCGP
jgi:chromosome segregation ATPase